MPLTLRPLTDLDIGSYTRLTNEAFSQGILSQAMQPNGHTEESLAFLEKKERRTFGKRRGEHILGIFDNGPSSSSANGPAVSLTTGSDQMVAQSPSEHTNTAAGTEAREHDGGRSHGELIAVARWRREDEVTYDERPPPKEPTPGSNQELVGAFFSKLDRHREEFMGRKTYWFLIILCTKRNHERRGAGTMLVRFGTAAADAEGLECFLDATEEGRPVYERQGFEVRKTVDWDLAEYGVEGHTVHCTMVRPAKGS